MASYTDVAGLFCHIVGAPASANMIAAVRAWTIMENGPEGTAITGNNPWNLHIGPDCPPTAGSYAGYRPAQPIISNIVGCIANRYAGPGDKDVAIFNTLQNGVAACVGNLEYYAARNQAGYSAVLEMARKGDAVGFLDALARSSWSAGHYGITTYPGTNKLVTLYKQLGGKDEPDVISLSFAEVAPADGTFTFDGRAHAAIPLAYQTTADWESITGPQTRRIIARATLAAPLAGGNAAIEDRIHGFIVVNEITRAVRFVLAKDGKALYTALASMTIIVDPIARTAKVA